MQTVEWEPAWKIIERQNEAGNPTKRLTRPVGLFLRRAKVWWLW